MFLRVLQQRSTTEIVLSLAEDVAELLKGGRSAAAAGATRDTLAREAGALDQVVRPRKVC